MFSQGNLMPIKTLFVDFRLLSENIDINILDPTCCVMCDFGWGGGAGGERGKAVRVFKGAGCHGVLGG